MTEIKALKAQRAVVKGQMTKLVTWVASIDDTVDIDDINSRLNRARDLLAQFTDLEGRIFLLDAEHDSQISEFSENFLTVESGLNRALRKMNSVHERRPSEYTLNTTQSNHHEVKLPKIHITPFSGDFTEWQTFYDLFVSTIHNNDNLSPVQKFQYLQSLLTGSASSILKHLSITEQNYFEVFKKLCKKYDRKRHTINAFLQTFNGQPTIHSATASSIQKLLDTSDEVIRGLKAMGKQAESRDPWLIFILINKLDDETKSQWAQHAFDKDFPTIDDFFEFLQRRVDALDSFQICSKSPSKAKTVRAHVATNATECSMCPPQQHPIHSCPKFQRLSVSERREFAKSSNRCFNCLNPSHAVFKCYSRKRCSTCNRKHHTLLHSSTIELNEETASIQSQSSSSKIKSMGTSSNCMHVTDSEIYSILPTAVVNVKDAEGRVQSCRVLLDSGSVSSFISEECVSRLKLKCFVGTPVSISGLGNNSVGKSYHSVNLEITSATRKSPILDVKAIMISKITSNLPEQTIPSRYFKKFVNLELADPSFNVSNKIDILLGVDHFFDILEPNQIKSQNSNAPTAQNTIFGWVIGGKWTQQEMLTSFFTYSNQERSTTDELLKRFWEVEELQQQKFLSEEEEACERLFNSTTTTNTDGRYIVKLPFKSNQPPLGKSISLAMTRLRAMERRFAKDEFFSDEYKKFMKEYEELGHMREICKPLDDSHSYYMPHHGIVKSSSTTTKLRVVFDGSAKSSSGQSLNNHLMVGATVQNSLYNVLLRFRMHKIVFTADVEKMYRQILVAPSDTPFQRIVWRTSTSEPVRHFELLTVTYGTAAAPFLATRVLKEIAQKNELEYPTACDAIIKDMYVDDIMSGAENEEKAIIKKNDVVFLLKRAGMNLRKFMSNSPIFTNTLTEEQQERVTTTQSVEIKDNSTNSVKVLGLHWCPSQDTFSFKVNLSSIRQPFTKRIILSEISQIFDPIGWLAPCLIRNKIFIQSLWLTSLQWDDKLPTTLEDKWLKLRMELPNLEQIVIPRWLSLCNLVELHLHGFCDASEAAYAAVVYIIVKNKSGQLKSSLISAKSKVAPIKQVSLPRLELCGATLLVKLMKQVTEAFEIKPTSTTAWTDSTIVLDWLSAQPRKWNTFVANRTSEILQETTRNQWRHIPSAQNPADCVTRGLTPNELSCFTLWWNGPSFLTSDIQDWPCQLNEFPETTIEARASKVSYATTVSHEFFDDLTSRYSSYFMLTKVLAFIFRYIKNIKSKMNRLKGPLMPDEVNIASIYIVKRLQEQEFATELAAVKNKIPVDKKSNLKSFNPFIDELGVLRVGGRISHSKASFETKHPILLPSKSNVTKLIIRDYHMRYYHAGATLLLSLLRQRYWVIRARDVIRQVINNCVTCYKVNPKPGEQQMGDLPSCRVEYTRPFLKVAIDYAGPVLVYHRRGRGQKSFKSYICFFVCLSTRAIHIELVCDLTSEAFIGALRRFIARRGICTDISSDCGSNFIGANNQLVEMFRFLKQNNSNISHSLLRDHIKWHFNPASAPHFNGIAEAAVKSTKTHLKRTIGNTILTVEEMTTLLVQVEAILNSRPLCVLSGDDIDALTPAHFIIHHPMTLIPEPDLREEKISHLTRWQLVQQIQQHFAKRWKREYLTSLQQRSKWTHKSPNIEIGDIVIIVDDNLPSTKWLLAKVKEVMPGNDGLVRAVSVQTKNGIITRPIHKLCKLPLD